MNDRTKHPTIEDVLNLVDETAKTEVEAQSWKDAFRERYESIKDPQLRDHWLLTAWEILMEYNDKEGSGGDDPDFL